MGAVRTGEAPASQGGTGRSRSSKPRDAGLLALPPLPHRSVRLPLPSAEDALAVELEAGQGGGEGAGRELGLGEGVGAVAFAATSTARIASACRGSSGSSGGGQRGGYKVRRAPLRCKVLNT